jgi:hypothetical protein
MNQRRLLIVAHVAAAAFVLPAFFFAGKPLAPGSIASTYRSSATAVLAVLVVAWNFAYWFKGFYPRIFRLSPEVQARTGARVVFRNRSIAWDRTVGWQAAVGLQLRFLGLVLTAFMIWGALLIAVITLLTVMNEGLGGAAKFFRG